MAGYLKCSAKRIFHKETFQSLIATPTTKSEMYKNLRLLKSKIFDKHTSVNFFETAFAFNNIALSKAKNALQRRMLQVFKQQENAFLRAKTAVCKNFNSFPCEGNGQTRIEQICQLFVVSTQLHFLREDFLEYKANVLKLFELSESEKRFFDDIFALTKARFFCAVYFFCGKDSDNGEFFASAFFNTFDVLNCQFSKNHFYSRTTFKTLGQFSAVDCLSNSCTIFDGVRTGAFLSCSATLKGRNIFDTFTNHKFGKKSCNFLSENKSCKVEMQYFVRENVEFRRFKVFSKSKAGGKIAFALTGGVQLDRASNLNCFEVGNAHCIGVSGEQNYYVAFAFVKNGKIAEVSSEFLENGTTAQLRLFADIEATIDTASKIDVVTIFARSIEQLKQTIEKCNCFGFTVCPIVSDEPCEGQLFAIETNVDSHSNLIEKRGLSLPSRSLNFNFQFGGNDSATFLDNSGSSVTLLNGFAFGIEGEKLFAVSSNVAKQLNSGKFELTNDGFRQTTELSNSKATIEFLHREGKRYFATFEKPMRLLALFAFEEQSIVTVFQNTFEVKSQNRHFRFVSSSKIESFTTNAIECNSARLRYKLSNDQKSGQCLAICFARAENISFKIENLKKTPKSTPMVRESLLSTYLNYVNDKNLFCLSNRLKPADCLTVASLAYNNPEYLKQFVIELENSTYLQNFSTSYYDNTAKLRKFVDKILYALAVVYYVSIANDREFFTEKRRQTVLEILFDKNYSGKNLCHKALALKKLSLLNVDKVEVLSELCTAKNEISKDKLLLSYAQAIGAVDMFNPSKQRLKDLCNSHNIPKCWYYVSQLENLYGVKINCGVIVVKPSVCAPNALEEFVLNYNGRKILTSFEKATVQGMVLNGVTYYNCVKTDLLKNENKMVVKY